MAVKIRLSRIGTKNAPCYRIIAVDSRKKRDGEFLENLGTYDPIKGQLIQFHRERIDYWVSKGAQTSLTVARLYKQHAKAGA